MRCPTTRVERIARARDWVTNHDYLQRQRAGGNSADGFQGLLSASAAFTISVKRRRGTIDDPISVAQHLCRFGDSLSRIRRALNRLSVENKFRVNESEGVRARRRRFLTLSVNHVGRGGRHACGHLLLLGECVQATEQQDRSCQNAGDYPSSLHNFSF